MEAILSLYELNNMVRELMEEGLPDRYWVRGELAEGRQAGGGHFYGELVDRDARGQNVTARARVNCWARTYSLVRQDFLRQTGRELAAGLNVLLQVSVTFHEQYGYSLTIHDIDPTYTLGDAAAKRRQIIEQLKADGLLEANGDLPLPLLTQRIAIVSSATAAGYGDFENQLKGNAQGYYFCTQLFPALMQGTGAPESIISALQQIAQEADQWDAVVIIRGGGATTDLSDFDSYPLAACVAQFPLPIITGIGHERDTTVLDVVAHTSLKTPTAVAAFLVERADTVARLLTSLEGRISLAAQKRLLGEQRWLDEARRRMTSAAQKSITTQRRQLDDLTMRLPLTCRSVIQRETNRLSTLQVRLLPALRLRLQAERHHLQLLAARHQGLDPRRLLSRGYSITTCGGRVVSSLSDLKEGGELVTMIENGSIISEIKSWKKQN